MSAVAGANDLIQVVTLLGATVVMVPIFRWIGLGSVLGYLMAGLIIGPFGVQLFTDSYAILHVAELGVVMFLFVIGLEMRPSHLWGMKSDIFGLGTLQILVCTALLTLVALTFGYSLPVSFIGAMGFVLTSTAIVMQLLGERGDIAQARGQKIVSILLYEDLLIVPLLALVAFMAPPSVEIVGESKILSVVVAGGSFAALIVAGIYLLNPLFHFLAKTRSREVMTAAALFVVLGAALLMQVSGLSMAMGAFVAGVLLAESSFRHQIEADVEPFRGLLLGLFFIGVGMSLNLDIVLQNWILILVGVLVMMFLKAAGIYFVARKMGTSHCDALDRAVLMAQGGEFAFVLFAAAANGKILTETESAILTALVIFSMVLTPLFTAILRRCPPSVVGGTEEMENASGLSGSVLMVGFGRFGQVISQLLLARNVDVTIIDSDPQRIRNAAKFGFKIYYGDGSRLDVLRTSGAENARAILICVDDKKVTNHIVEIVKVSFPQAKILARSYDRVHSRELVQAGVDYQVRETFESAFRFGEETLRQLGMTEDEVIVVAEEIRRRDRERFELEIAEGSGAGKKLMLGNVPQPTPLIEPQKTAIILSNESILAKD